MARKMTTTELNTWYGHDLYAKLTGQKWCDCEVCERLRDEITKGIKKVE